jgi:type IV secretion system protein VirB3
MSARNGGLTGDVLFVGATRPPMRWGVTYSALLANMVLTMEIFLLSRDLLALLLCVPAHALCALLCLRDPRIFDLALLSARTRLPSLMANHRLWGCCSHSPLPLSVPGQRRRTLGAECAQLWPTGREG